MNPQLIIAALIAAAGFGTAWKIQGFRMDAKEKEHVEQQFESERSAAKTAIRRVETVIEAQNAAANRERDLRGAAAGARAALVGLSSSADQALRDAATSHAACTERAAAIRVVLDQCGAAYQELGAVADRHVSDIQTLVAAWPK